MNVFLQRSESIDAYGLSINVTLHTARWMGRVRRYVEVECGGFSYKVVMILEPTIVRVMSMKSTDMLFLVKIQVRQLFFTASLKLVDWTLSSAVLWWSNETQQPMSLSINKL